MVDSGLAIITVLTQLLAIVHYAMYVPVSVAHATHVDTHGHSPRPLALPPAPFLSGARNVVFGRGVVQQRSVSSNLEFRDNRSLEPGSPPRARGGEPGSRLGQSTCKSPGQQ